MQGGLQVQNIECQQGMWVDDCIQDTQSGNTMQHLDLEMLVL